MGRFGWRALLRNRTALTGTVITSFVLLAIVIGAELMPYSATDMDFINILAPPSLEHPVPRDPTEHRRAYPCPGERRRGLRRSDRGGAELLRPRCAAPHPLARRNHGRRPRIFSA